MKIQFDNLFQINAEHGISKTEFNAAGALIEERLAGVSKHKQGFYEAIDDEQIVSDIEAYAKACQGRFDAIVVLGIGGSALGVKCLSQSLLPEYSRADQNAAAPRLFVIDNIDPALIAEVEAVLDYARTLFVVISKSGTTPEPMVAYLYFRHQLEARGLKSQDHMVFVTDPEKGVLRTIAQKENIHCFSVPVNVGGRYSVLTAVGLLPAALIGLDIRALLAGAQAMRDRFLSLDFKENLPYRLAAAQYLLYRKGKNINVLMPYSVKLDKFADWFMQLVAESTGKARNNYGEIINVGITPTKAIGTTDQHSQTQLYNEGPNNKVIILLSVEEQGPDLSVPLEHPDMEFFAMYHQVKFKELYDISRQANVEVFTKNQRPNLSISVARVDALALGELFMLFEAATALLGEFFEINAFDQPGVELSKVLTKEGLMNLKERN